MGLHVVSGSPALHTRVAGGAQQCSSDSCDLWGGYVAVPVFLRIRMAFSPALGSSKPIRSKQAMNALKCRTLGVCACANP